MPIVRFEKFVVNSILSHALNTYPREAILLLRGKKERDEILIDEIVVPPLATHELGSPLFRVTCFRWTSVLWVSRILIPQGILSLPCTI